MNNLEKFKTKILNKLQYDKELKELQIKEIDELMNEYKRPIFDKDNITLIKNNYKIKYLELKISLIIIK